MYKHYTMKRAFSCLFATAALLLVSLTVSAQTNFGGFQSNIWSNPLNWTNGLPAIGNDATIPGGAIVEINSNLSAGFTVTSYGTVKINAAVTNLGTWNNYTGSVMDIAAAASFTNNGTMDERGAVNIAAGGAFSNGSSASYSSTGTADINNLGTLNIAGAFSNFGTVKNFGTATITGGNFGNSTTLSNSGVFNFEGGTVTNVNGANINNFEGGTFNHKAGATLNNQGTLTNTGTYANNGSISSNGTLVNDGLFNNNIGGSITNNFRLNNNSTFNNNNQGNLVNEFEINNAGLFNNNFFVDNGGAINVLAGGTFNNAASGDINNQFGSTINNANIFTNVGEIVSVGDIHNSATFLNTGSIYTNTGGGIINSGNFTNNNLLSNLEEITNTGTFTNNGQLVNDSGGVFTNNGDLVNKQPARISNDYDIVNNQNILNFGTFENGVRVFNNKYFENNGYLINIGDFVNNATGIFENTGVSTTAGSNGGVLENTNGGVFTNHGILNNYNEIFNFACSSFINFGTINNYYWWTNHSLFFNYGTFNALPYHQMNMDGGVEITGPTSNLICEAITVSLDGTGKATITGSALSVEAYDDCTTLDLLVNDQISVNFTCANIGDNAVELTISDRQNHSVTCATTVTVVDDEAPVFQNCPANIIVTGNGTLTTVSWTAPTAADNCCGPVIVSSKLPGDQFPLGVTEVLYNAEDCHGNASTCDFTVTVVPPGDCGDVTSVRPVTNTSDICGNWCGDYVLTFGAGNCYTAGPDLVFIEYSNGTALLTGSVLKGSTKGFVEINFSGRTSSAPSGSPKYELCVNSGASGWNYYTSFSGKVTLDNCSDINIVRYGPSFQMGMGGNLQDVSKLGASGWFSTNGGSTHGGDFNFRLGDPRPCQNSIYLEAECASNIGNRWQVKNDAGASGGKLLLPPAQYSYDYPPVGTEDLVQFNVNVTVSGYYRLFARTIVPNGSGDSYWVRVNNGNWVKWNSINAPSYSGFQWDQVGNWDGCDNETPVSFYLNAGSNTIQFGWREPNACLDKLYLTFSGKRPNGFGGNAQNCGSTGTPTSDPFDGKVLCITSKSSNKSADITSASQTNGAYFQQWDASGAANQKFLFTKVGLNTYTITAKHSGKCLDAYASGTAPGTKVVQWDCHSGNNQKWVVESAGNGAFFIKNLANGLYLDVESASTANGAKIILWTKHGGANQQWKLEDCGAAPQPTCNKTALFVVGSTSLNASDAAVKARLISLGYTVTLKDDGACQSGDATGKGLILISSTCNSGYIGSKYKDVAVPVIVWEGWSFDDMKMTGTTANYHYGTADYVSKMTISNSVHPIAQGLTGTLSLLSTSRTVSWGLPGNGAAKIGYVPNNPNCVMLFAYDQGATMVGMTAPAKRVGFYLHNSGAEKLNNTGWMLFDRAVQWASGCNLGVNAEGDDEILKLKAVKEERHINLYWTNNTGFKNDMFIVEKSLDGTHFEAINERPAYRDEDKSTKLHEDFDFSPTIGVNYYRVRTIFLDGSELLSETQAVELNDISDFAVYPNPAGVFTNVNLENMLGQQNVTITVYDWIGHKMQELHLDEVTEPFYMLDLQDYKEGRYTVTVLPEGKRAVTQKLIISK